MKDLFAAARADAPPADVHEAVWDRVLDVTAAPPPASPAAVGTGLKMAALGVVVGAAVATTAFLVGTADDTSPPVHRTPATLVTGPAAGARLADPGPRGRFDAAAEPAAAPQPAILSATTNEDESYLSSEAHLVTAARQALVEGDPSRALALVDATKGLPTRRLVPEELGISVRALRALGRESEATAAETELRKSFPQHALSRHE